jgi:hypothetical protein
LGIAVKRKHCKDFGVWVYEFAWVSAGVHGFLPVSLGFVRVSVSFSRFFFVKVSIGFPEGFVVGLFVAGSVRFGSRCA